MADTRQKEKENEKQQPQGFMDKLISQAEEVQKKKQAEEGLRRKKEESDRRIEEMVESYIRAELEYGPEHYTTQMYSMFVDLVVPLKELSETMLGMQDAMSTLDSTLGVIDDTMSFMFGIMQQSARSKYGVMARFRQHRAMRKFIRNNNARMRSIQIAIESMSRTSEGLRKALGGFSIWMKANSAKQKERMAKKKAKELKKYGGDPVNSESGIFMSEAAQKLIEKKKLEMLGDSGNDSTSGGNTPPTKPIGGANTPKDGGASATAKDFDDIASF